MRSLTQNLCKYSEQCHCLLPRTTANELQQTLNSNTNMAKYCTLLGRSLQSSVIHSLVETLSCATNPNTLLIATTFTSQTLQTSFSRS